MMKFNFVKRLWQALTTPRYKVIDTPLRPNRKTTTDPVRHTGYPNHKALRAERTRLRRLERKMKRQERRTNG